jgi:hypothetical protein
MRLHASSHAYGLWTSRTKSTIGPEHPTTPRRKHEKTQDSKCWLTKIWRHLGDWCPCFSDCQRWMKGNYTVSLFHPLNILIKPMNPPYNWKMKVERPAWKKKTWAETCPHWISGIFNKRLKPAFMGDLPAMLVTRTVPWNPLKITIFFLVKTVKTHEESSFCAYRPSIFLQKPSETSMSQGIFPAKPLAFWGFRAEAEHWHRRCGAGPMASTWFNATYEYTITVKLYDIYIYTYKYCTILNIIYIIIYIYLLCIFLWMYVCIYI